MDRTDKIFGSQEKGGEHTHTSNVQLVLDIPRSRLVAPHSFCRKNLADRLRDYAAAALAAQYPELYDWATVASTPCLQSALSRENNKRRAHVDRSASSGHIAFSPYFLSDDKETIENVRVMISIPQSSLLEPRAFCGKRVHFHLRDKAMAALAAQHPEVYDAAIARKLQTKHVSRLDTQLAPLSRCSKAIRRSTGVPAVFTSASPELHDPFQSGPSRQAATMKLNSSKDKVTPSFHARTVTSSNTSSSAQAILKKSLIRLSLSKCPASAIMKPPRRYLQSFRGAARCMKNLYTKCEAFNIDALLNSRQLSTSEASESWPKSVYPFLMRNIVYAIKKATPAFMEHAGAGIESVNRKYRCDVCGAAYLSEYFVNKHKRMVHCRGVQRFRAEGKELSTFLSSQPGRNLSAWLRNKKFS